VKKSMLISFWFQCFDVRTEESDPVTPRDYLADVSSSPQVVKSGSSDAQKIGSGLAREGTGHFTGG
jgi:hypothetical protein